MILPSTSLSLSLVVISRGTAYHSYFRPNCLTFRQIFPVWLHVHRPTNRSIQAHRRTRPHPFRLRACRQKSKPESHANIKRLSEQQCGRYPLYQDAAPTKPISSITFCAQQLRRKQVVNEGSGCSECRSSSVILDRHRDARVLEWRSIASNWNPCYHRARFKWRIATNLTHIMTYRRDPCPFSFPSQVSSLNVLFIESLRLRGASTSTRTEAYEIMAFYSSAKHLYFYGIYLEYIIIIIISSIIISSY